MPEIYIARDASRYVQRERNVTLRPGQDHRLRNEVTGYKMVVSGDLYDSFIQVNGSQAWEKWSTARPLDREALHTEVAAGHLLLQ